MHREVINKENIKEDRRRKRKLNTFMFFFISQTKRKKKRKKKKVNRLVKSLSMEILVVGIQKWGSF